MQIYLARNNQQAGPYTVEQLNQMLANQQVLLTDLIWHEGMSEWKPLGEVTQGKFSYYPDGYQASSAPESSPFGYTATTPTQAQSTLKTPQTQTVSLAPISKRIFAKIIDMLLWLPAFLCLTAFMNAEQYAAMSKIQAQGVIPSPESQIALLHLIPTNGWIAAGTYLLFMLLIQAILIAKTGQSVGKKVLKIQIVDATSKQLAPVSRSFFLRSLIFIFIYNFTFLPLAALIDLLFITGKTRQTLHDRLAKTIVIEK